MLLVLVFLAVACGFMTTFLLSWEVLQRREQMRGHGRLRARLIGGTDGDVAGDRVPVGSAVSAFANSASPGSTVPAGRVALEQGVFIRMRAWFDTRLRARRRQALRQASYERDLPALLEVIALGMRAGMGFDQAFELYACRFDTALARLCKDPLDIWQRGLVSRESGMRELAERVDTPFFGRFVSTALRSLRYGAPMAGVFADLAQEARKDYRAKREAMVAKAPVKMLLPTGALILPAMLLLVMGPIILDLMGKLG